jgi:hypothetical protein
MRPAAKGALESLLTRLAFVRGHQLGDVGAFRKAAETALDGLE